MKKMSKKNLDKKMSAIYNRIGNGVQVNIFDLSYIYNAGANAHATGANIEIAMAAALNKVRKN